MSGNCLPSFLTAFGDSIAVNDVVRKFGDARINAGTCGIKILDGNEILLLQSSFVVKLRGEQISKICGEKPPSNCGG